MQAAAEELVRQAPWGVVDRITLDLSSLASVRAAATTIRERYDRLDVLVNNAGVMALPYRETADGVEMQFGTNHLGHFALAGLLLPGLASAPAARVVTVSSVMHRRGAIVFEDIPKPARYGRARAYAMSKLANLLFAFELDRRLQAVGSPIRSLACHPGYSATNLQGAGPAMSGSVGGGFVMRMGNALLAQSADKGALGTLYAATSSEVAGGDYVGPTGFFGLLGAPVRSTSSAASHDLAVAQRLWEVSETLSGVHYPFAAAVSAA